MGIGFRPTKEQILVSQVLVASLSLSFFICKKENRIVGKVSESHTVRVYSQG